MRIDDTRPIWIQLADNFRARITDGTWKPGQKIPSVRDLAIEAGTNPNTVQRALAALDDEGLTVPKRTAGRFVATDDTALRALRQEDARAAAAAFASIESATISSRSQARAASESSTRSTLVTSMSGAKESRAIE